MKRNVLLILALTAVMVFGFSAASVYANEDYVGLKMPGIQTVIKPGDQAGGSEWTYQGKTRTLILKNYQEAEKYTEGIHFASFDLNVVLIGENKTHALVRDKGDGSSPSTLTIDGEGTLVVSNGNISSDTVLIRGGYIHVHAAKENKGIEGTDVTISGNAEAVVAVAGDEAISAESTVKISENALVTISKGNTNEKGIVSGNGVEISDNANVQIKTDNTGIEAKQTIQISDKAQVTINTCFAGLPSGNMAEITGPRAGLCAQNIRLSGRDTCVDVKAEYQDIQSLVTDNILGMLGYKEITLAAPLGITAPAGGRIGHPIIKEVETNTTAEGTEAWTVCNPDGTGAQHVVIKAPDYRVTVAKTQNGTAAANVQKAKAGDPVTITARPASGCSLDKMTYTDASGKVTEIGASGQFTMPASDVTVNVSFKKTGAKSSARLMAKMTARGENSLELSWNRINGAAGYDIFFVQCDTTAPAKVETIKNGKKTKWTKKGLGKNTPYKAVVKAWTKKDGKKTCIKTSPMVHAYTSGGTKRFTNAGSVTVKKASLSIKAGKKARIRASVTKLQSDKKLMPKYHAPKLRYLSTDTKIATVDKKGKVRGVSKGSCYVYAYAHNGVFKKVKVTVK